MCKKQRKGKKNQLVFNKKEEKVSPSAKRQECLGEFGVGMWVHRLKVQQMWGDLGRCWCVSTPQHLCSALTGLFGSVI